MAPGSPRSAAPKTAAPTARAVHSGTVPLVGGARLPLAFIVGGLVAFALGAGWLALSARHGLLPHVHPQIVALAHLWLPGFLLSVCLGASYQLMPVVLGTPLRASTHTLWIHAGLHVIGVAVLVFGLAVGRYAWAGLGGLAVSAGIIVLLVATLHTFVASGRRDAAALSFPLSSAWLTATVLAGVLLALNRRTPFLSLSALDLLRAHAHLGLVGYFLTLLQGITFQLVPMFTMGEARRPRTALAGLIAGQLGLVCLAAGLAWSIRSATLLGAGLLLASLATSGVAFSATLKTRRRRRLDPGVRAFVIGLGLLALGALLGGAIVFLDLSPERVFPAAHAYGLLLIAGGLSLTILGMLGKILPFLVWMKAYGPSVGRMPVPLATTLASRPLEHVWLGGHLAGLGLLAGGEFWSHAALAFAGGALLAFAAIVYLANAARVLWHLRRSSAPTAPTTATTAAATIPRVSLS